MIDNIIEYARGMSVQPDVLDWVNTHLKPFLEKERAEQSEIEHIIDYFASDKRPKRISKMSYQQAKSNTDKWNKTLIKKGSAIEEKPEDVEIIKDFEDGFKIVKLVGENAYKREGFLMRHCLASYYGSDKQIYSLRDKDNMPHCTMEHGQQIKGKGNGSIHPNYIKYIVDFLEQVGMSVGDDEMKNLGYVNIERIKSKLHQKKNNFFNEKYLYQEDIFYGEDGEEYSEFDLWQHKPIVTRIGFEIKFNFKIEAFIEKAVKKVLDRVGEKVAVANERNSTAVANERNSTAVANERNSTAVANAHSSTAVANESYSTAVANESYSTAVANESYSTAVANAHSSTAVANESYSTAVANEIYSTAVANERNSVALCRGYNSKAKGELGAWLVLAEYDENKEHIINIVSGKVDNEALKEGVLYTVKNGKFEKWRAE